MILLSCTPPPIMHDTRALHASFMCNVRALCADTLHLCLYFSTHTSSTVCAIRAYLTLMILLSCAPLPFSYTMYAHCAHTWYLWSYYFSHTHTETHRYAWCARILSTYGGIILRVHCSPYAWCVRIAHPCISALYSQNKKKDKSLFFFGHPSGVYKKKEPPTPLDILDSALKKKRVQFFGLSGQ